MILGLRGHRVRKIGGFATTCCNMVGNYEPPSPEFFRHPCKISDAHGSGFYDNYYNKNKSKFYIGYVYTKQIFNTLPFAKHDLKLNAIVTESFVKKINHINK